MSSFTLQDISQQAVLLEPELLLLPHDTVRHHAVVVRDGRFARVGATEQLQREHPQLPRVRLERTLLMPGFVDTHTHLTQSFGKSLVFGEPSEIFRRVWVPLEEALDDESGYVAAKLAALESLRGGFTTVVDAGTRMPAGIDPVAEAAVDAGIRCVLGLVCNDLGPGGNILAPEGVLSAAERHLARWSGHPLVHASLAVSIPEAATPTTLAAIADLCARSSAVFQTHVNEHLAAIERALERTGRRPLEALADHGVLGPHALLAHATMLTPTEVALLRDTGAAVSYNPVASAWKGNAVAPATTFAADGIRFGIGTDGTRSDAFRLLDAAETAQRLSSGLHVGDSSAGAGWTWLEHGTTSGAEAAGLSGVAGAIREGLAADYLLVDLDVPELVPSWDLSWELVRLVNRDQVTAVVVGGHPRLWQRWPVDWDARTLMEDANRLAQKALASAPVLVVHPTSTDHRAGSLGRR